MQSFQRTVAAGLAILMTAAIQVSAAKSTVKFDPAKSEIKWVGKKVTGQHNGTIKLKSGHVLLDGNQVTGGNFVVDMTTLANSDIDDPESKAKLTKHLKSDDFFGVDKHPQASLIIKTVKPIKTPTTGGPTHEITGDLTIKGKTAPVTFPAVVKISDKNVHGEATVTVDRTKYDVRYGSGKFFQNLGDKTIYDDFTLQVHLEGTR